MEQRIRMWVVEEAYNNFDPERKFHVDAPSYIHQKGEFIDSDQASGWVKHVQSMYNFRYGVEFSLVIYVYLVKDRREVV